MYWIAQRQVAGPSHLEDTQGAPPQLLKARSNPVLAWCRSTERSTSMPLTSRAEGAVGGLQAYAGRSSSEELHLSGLTQPPSAHRYITTASSICQPAKECFTHARPLALTIGDQGAGSGARQARLFWHFVRMQSQAQQIHEDCLQASCVL